MNFFLNIFILFFLSCVFQYSYAFESIKRFPMATMAPTSVPVNGASPVSRSAIEVEKTPQEAVSQAVSQAVAQTVYKEALTQKATPEQSTGQLDTFNASFTGSFVQGGMILGQAMPDTKITVLKKTITADSQGEFVFGVGRDAPKKIEVVLASPTGEEITKTIEIKQRQYKTQSIEGVARKYVAPPKEVTARIKKDNSQVWLARQKNSAMPYYKSTFILPAKGPITGVYGSQRIFNGTPKRPHFGLDIAGPVGTDIIAPAAGTVRLAHNDMYYSGGTLIIDHGKGISSTFIHLNKIHVKQGQQIKQGELIADMGATGRVTGPHLDWRINWFNQRLDPAFFVQALLPKELFE